MPFLHSIIKVLREHCQGPVYWRELGVTREKIKGRHIVSMRPLTQITAHNLLGSP